MRHDSPIVFVSHTAEPGGAELALSRYLRLSALKYSLISLQDGPLWNGLGVNSSAVNELAPEIGVLSGLRYLRRQLVRRDPELIIANSMRAAFYCAITKPRDTRLVYWVRDGLRESAMSKLNLWLTSRITLPQVDYCIANSRWTADTIRAVNANVPISVVPSPCGLGGETIPEPRKEFLVKNQVALLYLGRLSRWKGVHHAISTLAELVGEGKGIDYRLTIAGAALFDEQDYERGLRDKVTALGLEKHVVFAGHVDDVPSLLAQHDILLHCSDVPEPFGQVIVQALGAGIGVIAADAGGPREIIESGLDGLLYEPGNTSALQGAVQQIVDNDMLPTLSGNALIKSRSYTDESIVSRLDTILSGLMNGGVEFVEH